MGSLCSLDDREEDVHDHAICQKILIKQRLRVQCGISGSIQYQLIQATDQQLFVYNNNDNGCESFRWSSLKYVDDFSDKKTLHCFQFGFHHDSYSKLQFYCDSRAQRNCWMEMFQTFKPISKKMISSSQKVMTKCAKNMGFKTAEIECAFMLYQQYYPYDTKYEMKKFKNTLCNLKRDYMIKDEHKLVFGYIREVENDLEGYIPSDIFNICYAYNGVNKKSDSDIICSVCKDILKLPVSDIYGEIFCFEHTDQWKRNGQSLSKDPVTKKPLPQNCRLLAPNFNKLVEIYNQQNTKNQFSINIKKKLQNIDKRIGLRQQNICKYLRKTEEHEKVTEEILNSMAVSNKFIFDKENLDDMITETCEYMKQFKEIEQLIVEGTKIYNKNIKKLTKTTNHLLKWEQPKWKANFKPDKQNWSEVYQVEQKLCDDINRHTVDLMNNIYVAVQKTSDSSIETMKEEILTIILQKQKEISNELNLVNEQLNDTEDTEDKLEVDEKINKIESNTQYRNIKKIEYVESHGYVNTKCLREISECITNEESFELYHSDLQHQKMDREQIIRFLNTAGVEGVEFQHYLYLSLAKDIKHKLLSISNFLRELKMNDEDFEQWKGYYPYFMHLETVQIINSGVKAINDENDKVQIKAVFNCDYDEHITKYGNKKRLCDTIRAQMLRHLNLDDNKHRISVNKLKKGSIEAIIEVTNPFLMMLGGFTLGAGLIGYGMYDFYCCIKRAKKDPDYYISWRRAMMQCGLVGGGIGSIVGAGLVIGGIIAMGPVAVIAGCLVAGAVLGGVIGIGIWKYLKHRRNRIEIEIYQDDDSSDDDNSDDMIEEKPMPIIDEVNEPLTVADRSKEDGGNLLQISVRYIGDIDERIKENESETKITLDCGHTLDYKPEIDQYEGNRVVCPDPQCKEQNDITAQKERIHDQGGNHVADISIVHHFNSNQIKL